MARLICLVLLSFSTVVLCGRSGGKVKQDEQDKCANVFCGIGRECIVDFGNPICDCIERCRDPPNPVCGSDHKTYENECELEKEACRSGRQIEVVLREPCPKEEGPNVQNREDSEKHPKPVVCLEKERNKLRNSLIEWIKMETDILVGNRPLKQVLRDYFDVLDFNNDSLIDTMEFMRLLERNQSITEVLNSDRRVNPILRGLCTDALIAITDKDSDLKLAFEEFIQCLDPAFKPPKQTCELNGVVYEDGAEISQDCNTCACACGRWVCTSLKCNENTVYSKLKNAESKIPKPKA